MIHTIKAGVDFTCSVIHYGLYISYKIGHFLVNGITFLQKIIMKLIYLLLEVLGAVFESIVTFYQDVVQNFQYILRTISSVDIITYLSDFRNIIQSIVFIVVTLSDLIVKMILSVVCVIQAVLLCPKYFLLYVMKNLVFIVTSIKEAFNDLCNVFFGSMYFLCQKTRDLVLGSILFWIHLPQTLYDLILDVPVESMLGIMISCCLIYLFARFYVIMLSYLYRQLRKLLWIMQRKYVALARYFTRSTATATERPVYRRQILPSRRPNIRPQQTLPNRRPSRRAAQSVNLSKTEDDRYCVICQEHIKCVLVLPCRHLCMCTECVYTLQLYHNTCPICRSEIQDTMQVFL